jgi:putative glycosyltransferase
MRLSVVTTLYRSSAHLGEFCQRIVAVADTITPEFELVLVNDGSPDDSLATARRLLRDEPRLLIVDLARNYGYYRAIMAGLRESRGGRVFVIDCDLEEPPELLASFWRELDADSDLDLVFGQQGRRRGAWSDRIFGRVYYAFLDRVSPVSVPRTPVVARLATRPYVEALLAHGEEPISFDALSALAGFHQTGSRWGRRRRARARIACATRWRSCSGRFWPSATCRSR